MKGSGGQGRAPVGLKGSGFRELASSYRSPEFSWNSDLAELSAWKKSRKLGVPLQSRPPRFPRKQSGALPEWLRQVALGRRSACSDTLHTQPDSHQSQQEPLFRLGRGGDEPTGRARSPWTPSRAGDESRSPPTSTSAQVRNASEERRPFCPEADGKNPRFPGRGAWSAVNLLRDLNMRFSFNGSDPEELQISLKRKLQPHFSNPSS